MAEITPHQTGLKLSSLLYLLGHPHPAQAEAFPNNLTGFQAFLAQGGIKYFSAEEMVRPHNLTAAIDSGYLELLPCQSWWLRGLVLAAVSDKCRELARGPVHMRNWWRPMAYNRLVGGAKQSDHTMALAVDLDFRARLAKRRALKWLEGLYASGLFGMGLGVGARTIHISLFSPRGQRRWKY